MIKIILFGLVASHFVTCFEKKITTPSENLEYEPMIIIEQFRHGERTPMKNNLNEKWIESSGGGGQLTEVGMKHHFKAGEAVAKAYPNLFKKFQVGERNKFYKVYSSQSDRTIESAQAHMLGLFNYYLKQVDGNKAPNLSTNNPKYIFTGFNDLNKGDSDIKYNKNLKEAALGGSYIPQSIDVKEKKKDKLFLNDPHYACPRAANKLSNASKEGDIEISKLSQDLVEKIKKHGIDQTKFNDEYNLTSNQIYHLGSYITMYKYYFGILPPKVTDELQNEITFIQNMAYSNRFADKEGSKFQTTNISKFVEDKFKQAMGNFEDEQQYYKYMALSGHDTSITPFQINLGLTNYSCWAQKYKNSKESNNKNKTNSKTCQPIPLPTANIIWELSRKQDKEKIQFYVRMQYNGMPLDQQCKNKILGNYCEFSSWEEANNKYFIYNGDYNSFCGKHLIKTGNINGGLLTSQIIIIVILLAFITYFIIRYKTVLKISEIMHEKDEPSNMQEKDELRIMRMNPDDYLAKNKPENDESKTS